MELRRRTKALAAEKVSGLAVDSARARRGGVDGLHFLKAGSDSTERCEHLWSVGLSGEDRRSFFASGCFPVRIRVALSTAAFPLCMNALYGIHSPSPPTFSPLPDSRRISALFTHILQLSGADPSTPTLPPARLQDELQAELAELAAARDAFAAGGGGEGGDDLSMLDREELEARHARLAAEYRSASARYLEAALLRIQHH
jgi:hypothetical protein